MRLGALLLLQVYYAAGRTSHVYTTGSHRQIRGNRLYDSQIASSHPCRAFTDVEIITCRRTHQQGILIYLRPIWPRSMSP